MKHKTLSIIICLIIAITACFTGCSGVQESAEVEDPTKSQLYVGVFDAGLGTQFMESIKVKFQDRFKDYSFEEGKTGVQVHIDPNRNYTGANLTRNIKSSRNDVFFAEAVDYSALLTANALADITDAVTSTLDYFGESESIEDKMYDQSISYFNSNDRYYGIPFYESYTGIVYDAELFNNNYYYIGNKGNYVNADGFTALGAEEGLSSGPDGNPATTFDNGFPATYDEFFELVSYISVSATPFIWTGKFPYYANWVGTSLWSDYEGEENMYINFNVNGTATDLIDSIDGSGNITYMSSTAINENNYYLVGRQAGRYYAAQFIENVVRSGGYTGDSFSPSITQQKAQQNFLYSNRLGGKVKPIAMLFEGTWWENEASGVFKEMSKKYMNSGKTQRKLGFMPLPKANATKVGEKQTLLAIGEAAVVVNANTKASKKDLITKFLQFIRTDEMLADFTAITSVPLSYKYTLSEKQYNEQLTYFGRSVWDCKTNSNIVYPTSNAPLYLKNQGGKLNTGVLWDANIGGDSVQNMTPYFKDNLDKHATDYFWGIVKDYENTFKKK